MLCIKLSLFSCPLVGTFVLDVQKSTLDICFDCKRRRNIFIPQSYLKAQYFEIVFSYDVASGSEITPCNKIDKPLVVYRFTGNVMTSITPLRT